MQKNNVDSPTKSPSTKKRNRAFIPSWRSGSYALLLTLYEQLNEPNYPGYISKSELQEKAQDKCDASFTVPNAGSYYTAWTSMSTLIKKGFVTKSGFPAKYAITKEGEELAIKLLDSKDDKTSPKKQSNSVTSSLSSSADQSLCSGQSALLPEDGADKCSKLISNDLSLNGKMESVQSFLSSVKINITEKSSCDSQNSSQKSNEHCSQKSCSSSSTNYETDSEEQLIFEPDSFEIKLLIDIAETSGYMELSNDVFITELTKRNIILEVRRLKIGDFIWIARNNNGKELVLPYIIERKRMDDFGSSIKDGRFHEQKFRLKQCGLQNVVYLIEKHSSSHLGLPLNTLQQAIANTQIIDEFYIKITSGYQETIHYLASLTDLLTNMFSKKMLISCSKNNLSSFNIDDDCVSLMTFNTFSLHSAKKYKNFKVAEMFIKQLIQIRGLTVEKAVAIVNRYPTPRHLMLAYEEIASQPAGEIMLADIKYGSLNKRIGQNISKILYHLYTKSTLS